MRILEFLNCVILNCLGMDVCEKLFVYVLLTVVNLYGPIIRGETPGESPALLALSEVSLCVCVSIYRGKSPGENHKHCMTY